MIVPNYFEDLSVLHKNTLPNRAYYIPTSTPRGLLPEERETSDRFLAAFRRHGNSDYYRKCL